MLIEHTGPELIVLKPDVPWQKLALEAIERAWQDYVREQAGFPFLVRNALSELIWLLHSIFPPVFPPSEARISGMPSVSKPCSAVFTAITAANLPQLILPQAHLSAKANVCAASVPPSVQHPYNI